jgi:hypothetical protein
VTVYFALGLQSGRIKIGCVRRSLAARIRTHERNRGERLVVLATTHGGRRVEAWWHRRHATSAERGELTGRITEWFSPAPALLADIVELINSESRA